MCLSLANAEHTLRGQPATNGSVAEGGLHHSLSPDTRHGLSKGPCSVRKYVPAVDWYGLFIQSLQMPLSVHGVILSRPGRSGSVLTVQDDAADVL